MAKTNGKSQCGGKISKKQKQKKSNSTTCGPCKKTLCDKCKRKMGKKKRCPKNPSYYNLFFAYVHRRLKAKYPNMKQCMIMKKAGICWKKLNDDQKADFKRKCDAGEIKSGKGRVKGRGNNPPNSGNGGGNGGGCSNSARPQVFRPSFPFSFNSCQPQLSQISQQPSRETPPIQRSIPYQLGPPIRYISTNKSFP